MKTWKKILKFNNSLLLYYLLHTAHLLHPLLFFEDASEMNPDHLECNFQVLVVVLETYNRVLFSTWFRLVLLDYHSWVGLYWHLFYYVYLESDRTLFIIWFNCILWKILWEIFNQRYTLGSSDILFFLFLDTDLFLDFENSSFAEEILTKTYFPFSIIPPLILSVNFIRLSRPICMIDFRLKDSPRYLALFLSSIYKTQPSRIDAIL